MAVCGGSARVRTHGGHTWHPRVIGGQPQLEVVRVCPLVAMGLSEGDHCSWSRKHLARRTRMCAPSPVVEAIEKQVPAAAPASRTQTALSVEKDSHDIALPVIELGSSRHPTIKVRLAVSRYVLRLSLRISVDKHKQLR
jgi:hypothetical protein